MREPSGKRTPRSESHAFHSAVRSGAGLRRSVRRRWNVVSSAGPGTGHLPPFHRGVRGGRLRGFATGLPHRVLRVARGVPVGERERAALREHPVPHFVAGPRLVPRGAGEVGELRDAHLAAAGRQQVGVAPEPAHVVAPLLPVGGAVEVPDVQGRVVGDAVGLPDRGVGGGDGGEDAGDEEARRVGGAFGSGKGRRSAGTPLSLPASPRRGRRNVTLRVLSLLTSSRGAPEVHGRKFLFLKYEHQGRCLALAEQCLDVLFFWLLVESFPGAFQAANLVGQHRNGHSLRGY